MKSRFALAVFFFVAALSLFTPEISLGQQARVADDDVLARIGPQTITARELLERIELMPWPGKENPATQDSARIKAMLSLVAEKLLAQDASNRGYVSNPENSSLLRGLERVLARDELYRTEILGKTAISDEEIERGLLRYETVRKLDSYILDSEDHARQLAAALGAQRDSVKPSIPTAGIISRDSLSLSYADVSREFENQVYSLEEIGDASAVNNSQLGWLVLHLRDIELNPSFAKENVGQRRQTVVRKERQRQEIEISQKYKKGFFTDQIKMDSVGFALLADNLLAAVLRDTAAHRLENLFALRSEDIDATKQALGSELNKAFISMGELEISLGTFLDELRFHVVRFNSVRQQSFYQSLNKAVMSTAGTAFLSHEAMRLRLNQHGSVQEDMKVWVDATEAEYMLRRLVDSLSNESDSALTPKNATEAGKEISKYIARLAEMNKLSIDFQKVKNLNVAPSNMVTRRFLGFGGAMLARPMTLRLWEWLEFWQKGKTATP